MQRDKHIWGLGHYLPAVARLASFSFLRYGACIKVVIRHQFGFHVIHRILQALDELHYIFFVQKYFVFFVRETLAVLMIPSFTLCDRNVVVVRTR